MAQLVSAAAQADPERASRRLAMLRPGPQYHSPRSAGEALAELAGVAALAGDFGRAEGLARAVTDRYWQRGR